MSLDITKRFFLVSLVTPLVQSAGGSGGATGLKMWFFAQARLFSPQHDTIVGPIQISESG